MTDPVLDALLKDRSGRFNKTDDFLGDLLSEPSPVGIGDVVRYDHLRQRWLVWNGVRWRPDLTERVNDMTRVKAGEWMGSSGFDGEDRKAVMPIFDGGKKAGVLKSLRARPEIAMTGNEWDTDGMLVGFENGIMDFRTPGDLIWHDDPDPSLMVSKSVGVDWDPEATCPTFDWFLGDIMDGDEALVAYLRRLVGYSLLGTQAEQKFWMWVGRGSNGKGVLARTLRYVFGDYGDAPADTLYMRSRLGAARSDSARPDLLRLQSIRFTYMSEPPGGQFNEEMLKAHTGEDMILARNLYAKAEQMALFSPTHKIVFLTNDPPRTDDVGVSMSRRVRVVRFEQDYSESPDRTLEDRLKRERAGILNLAIREAHAWLTDGMPEPDAVLRWSQEYINENDPLSDFIKERCAVGRLERGQSSSLWGSYEEWAKAQGVEAMSRTGFGLALGRRFKSKHTETGKVYLGIRALNAGELADAAE